MDRPNANSPNQLTRKKPTERFSNRVENYSKYRPAYPAEILESLHRNCGLDARAIVADIGSGTGILSQLFLRHGNQVFGIEPNPEMRAAGESFLAGHQNFISVAATAEKTTLADRSVDFIVAGQAFHWFDRQQARTEFERILKPDGWVVLVWNERLTTTPFLSDYEALLQHYSCDYEHADHRKVTQPAVLAEFYKPGWYRLETFPSQQTFDFAALRGRLLSSSYVPAEDDPGYYEVLRRLKEIFQHHARQGSVAFEYETKLFYGRFTVE
jgi:SAM-dependent methyltransferase